TDATFDQGDANGDGRVDGADFLVWQRSIGPAVSLTAFDDPALGSSAIPEPATIVLLLAATALLRMWSGSRAR
ncbi:MAG TPA: PEP-CTERM sorting domain-containing protein, partial [Lacipirellulaceae bacterium]|nr:PEP-CTERM sorting domain-containing protein [Lacipirellulaceae bacterium]